MNIRQIGMKRLCGVTAVLLVLSGCATSPCTFKYTPEMQSVRERALAGDVSAMRQMAAHHWDIPDDCNRRVACHWLEQAGGCGDAMSSELVGWCYLTGRGVARDRAVAARYFEQAADQYWMWWSLVMNGHKNNLWMLLLNDAGDVCELNNSMYGQALFSIVDNYNRAIYLGRTTARNKKLGMLGGFSEIVYELSRIEAESGGKSFEQYLTELYSKKITESFSDTPFRGDSTPIGYRVVLDGEYSYWKIVTNVWLCRYMRDAYSSLEQILALGNLIKGLETTPNLQCDMPIPAEIRLPDQYLELVGIAKKGKVIGDEDYWDIVITPIYAEGSDALLREYYSTFARSDWRRALLCVMYYSLQKWCEEKGAASCREVLSKVLSESNLIAAEEKFIYSAISESPTDE